MENRELPKGFDGPRACGAYDLAPTIDLINQVFRTQPTSGVPRAPSMGWDYSPIYHPDNLQNVRIICHRGRPIASIGIYPTTVRTARGTLSVGGINAVATHPDYRRLGLATAILQDCHATMLAQGMHVGLLSTGITNYYRKLGWERAGQQRTFLFDRRNVTYLPETTLNVTEDWAPYVDAICALHNQRTGATRTPERFGLLALRKMDRLFVALRGGTAVAYVATTNASVREYAGEAEDIAGLLRYVFTAVENLPEASTDRSGGTSQFEMTVVTPVTASRDETGLAAILLDLGVPTSIGYQGMLAILDAPSVFNALGINFQIERHGQGWRMKQGSGAVDLTEGELVKIVFGPERRPDLRLEGFPVDFFQWPADRV
jgi:GNAT superfamily N-acetyltransferase